MKDILRMQNPSITQRSSSSFHSKCYTAFRVSGPAITASIAYLDPGNFATNIQAGTSYGYTLLWVVLTANIIATLFQILSARLAIVSGRNLAYLCRQYFPKSLVFFMWITSEIAAMATDLAEFIGGAIGFSLLLHQSLTIGLIITAILTFILLTSQKKTFRPLEIITFLFVSIIGICFLIELFIAPPNWVAIAVHSFSPSLPDKNATTLAVGIIGATVMPHALYLHSGLSEERALQANNQETGRLLKYSNRETIIALFFAGCVNMAMLILAANIFHGHFSYVSEIEQAYPILKETLGFIAAIVFLIALIASGIASSVIGTVAGQMIMDGFVRFRISLWTRRLITMLPSFILIGMGFDPTKCLIISQVILSLTLPIPMIALLYLIKQPAVMKKYILGNTLTSVASVATLVILSLNFMLVLQSFGINLPGLSTL